MWDRFGRDDFCWLGGLNGSRCSWCWSVAGIGCCQWQIDPWFAIWNCIRMFISPIHQLTKLTQRHASQIHRLKRTRDWLPCDCRLVFDWSFRCHGFEMPSHSDRTCAVSLSFLRGLDGLRFQAVWLYKSMPLHGLNFLHDVFSRRALASPECSRIHTFSMRNKEFAMVGPHGIALDFYAAEVLLG